MKCGDCVYRQRMEVRGTPKRRAKIKDDGTVVRAASQGKLLAKPFACKLTAEFCARTRKACEKIKPKKEDKNAKRAPEKATKARSRHHHTKKAQGQRPGGEGVERRRS